jgi:glycosyltransferase involved in cell wall biosynthesis
MMDIAGGAAILIDPEDAASAAAAIAARIGEAEALRQAGLANARNYSMDNTIDAYGEVYRELVSASQQGR